jgi:hypothetical protein
MAELTGPGNQGAISRDLVMLDRLSGADHCGIKDLLVLHFACHFVCFSNKPIDCGALHALRLLAEFLERLIEPRDLVPRFLEVIFEPLGQIAVGRLIDSSLL